jgi:hypothetical protein
MTKAQDKQLDNDPLWRGIFDGLPPGLPHHQKFALRRLLGWLNWKDAPADDFRKLTDLVVKRSLEAQKEPLDYKSSVRWDRRIDPLCRRIAQRFPTYVVPYLGSEGHAEPYLDRRPMRKDLRNSYDLEACFAIGHLFELFSSGVLVRVARCEQSECRRYFCGRRGRLFCSGSCKRKATRTTDRYREINALHQRVHYRAERVKDLQHLAAADPARRKEFQAAKKALERIQREAKRAKKRLAPKERR